MTRYTKKKNALRTSSNTEMKTAGESNMAR
jgi:hypothetical protein